MRHGYHLGGGRYPAPARALARRAPARLSGRASARRTVPEVEHVLRTWRVAGEGRVRAGARAARGPGLLSSAQPAGATPLVHDQPVSRYPALPEGRPRGPGSLPASRSTSTTRLPVEGFVLTAP